MNIDRFKDYSTRPADIIERGAETLSRLSGVAAFVLALLWLLFLFAR